jgi:ATP-dependent RNA helicase RhlE
MSFDSLGLTPELLRAVKAEGYTEPTPVQAQAIPAVLERRDLLAGAQTGTGLPIRCLVLTPTRELALQVEEFVRNYGKEQPIRSTTVYGGVGYDAQIKAVQGGPEIVVATPGRLLDIAGQGKIDLRNVEILVLDEADRMLDMGFIRDIRRILALMPQRRQNLMFSATFAEDVRELAATFLHDPVEIQIARRNAAIELVRQVVYPVDRVDKRDLLSWLIRSGRIDRALVFCRTKHGANRLAEQLDRDGIDAAAIHGNKSQGQRVKALDDFKEGRVAILVATEIAARGLDIDGLPHVVNFELPTVREDYVHRIGRTGRAGLEGDAISLVSAEEADMLADIESMLRREIPREIVPGFEPSHRLPATGLREESAPRRYAGPSRSGNRPQRSGGQRPAPHRSQSYRSPAGQAPSASGGQSRSGQAGRGSGYAPARGSEGRGNGQRPQQPSRPMTSNGSNGGSSNGSRSTGSTGERPFAVMPGERFSRTSG